MGKIKVYIFRGGGVFIAGILGYYACVCGSWPETVLYTFWSIAVIALTFNDIIDLRL